MLENTHSLTGNEILEIYCDASLKTIDNRVFTCSGALCSITGEEKYTITPDSTNNRGELLAVYLGVRLAAKTIESFPGRFGRVNLYSDSQFVIYGLREWMSGWLSHKKDGILYGSSGKPVKNQEMFMMIITYCVINKLVVNFYNQRGHTNTNSPQDLALANTQFKTANGFYLKPEDIFKISFYNDIVDKNTRAMLEDVIPNTYPVLIPKVNGKVMCRYVVPNNFKEYIR